MSSIALYYPWMHFQDEDWLKLALLSWNRIVRVRPPGVEDRDSDLVRQVCVESDLILEKYPGDSELDEVAEAFCAVLDYTATGGGVPETSGPSPGWDRRQRFRDPRALVESACASSPDVAPWRTPESQRPRGAEEDLFWVYCGEPGKMSSLLRDALVDAGLAVDRTGREPWVGLPPRVGSAYMAALADVMARSNALSPVTDDGRVHRATGALDHLAELVRGGAGPASQDARSAYMHLTLSAALQPRGIATVPVSRLLKFRERHWAELAAFREHIDSLASELDEVARVRDPAMAQAHLQALYEKTTKKHLNDLQRALRSFDIDSAVGALELKVDLGAASGTALGAAAAAGGNLALGTAAVTVSVLPYVVRTINARSQKRTRSPAAYLLAANKEFNRKTR